MRVGIRSAGTPAADLPDQLPKAVVEAAADWDRAMTDGTAQIVYRFDHEVRSEEHVRIEDGKLHIEGLAPISLLD